MQRIGSTKYLSELDCLARSLTDLPRQRCVSSGSDKAMPRLLWKDGISNLTDLTASCKVGIMFTVTVLSLRVEGQAYFSKVLGNPRAVNDMRECFQMILCYWMWLKKDKYWVRNDYECMQNATNAIRAMLSRIVDLWPRQEGQGWELAKFHEQLHVPDDIYQNGAPLGTHSGPVEHNHIRMVKRPCHQTQKRRTELDKQLAKRIHEIYLVNTALEKMQSSYSITADDNLHVKSG